MLYSLLAFLSSSFLLIFFLLFIFPFSPISFVSIVFHVPTPLFSFYSLLLLFSYSPFSNLFYFLFLPFFFLFSYTPFPSPPLFFSSYAFLLHPLFLIPQILQFFFSCPLLASSISILLYSPLLFYPASFFPSIFPFSIPLLHSRHPFFLS